MRFVNKDFVLPTVPVDKPPTWSNPGGVFKRIEWGVINSLVNTGIIENDMEIKVPANWSRLIGIYVTHVFQPGVIHAKGLNGEVMGYFILHINSKGSNPVQLPITAKVSSAITRGWDVLKLDEHIIGGTRFQAEVRSDHIDVINLRVYLKVVAEYRR